MKVFLKIYCSLLLMGISFFAAAQNTDLIASSIDSLPILTKDPAAPVQVRHIYTSGNKKTKEYILLREIGFKPGDSLTRSALPAALHQARRQVYNLSLFNKVSIRTIPIAADTIDVLVEVKERWYIFPIPQFQLVDRNLNEWLVQYHGDLSRVDYGVKFYHYNLTGRKDPFRITLLNGYSRNITFSYSQPYINRALTVGLSGSIGYAQTRQVAYATTYNNKLLFFGNRDFVIKTIAANAGLTIRKKIKARHNFLLGYTWLQVSDSVVTAAYNPAYLRLNRASKGFTDLTYSFEYIDVNNINYPLKGVTGSIAVSKRGWGIKGGINMLSLQLNYNKYWSLQNKWFASIQSAGRIKLPFNQAYINQKALGYGEAYLRGMEYYVIDGVAWGLARSTLKKKIGSFSIPFPSRSKTRFSIPFVFFAKTFADLGYSYNKKVYDSYFNNRFLYTGGLGIDILTFYDINLRFEYSFNQLGENGLFLHTQGGF